MGSVEIDNFINMVYSVGDIKKRRVVYKALADLIASYIIDVEGVDDLYIKEKLPFRIKKIVDGINELAIINRSEFEHYLKRSVETFIDKDRYKRISSVVHTDIYSIIGISSQLSTFEIEDINNNIEVYNNTIKYSREVIETLACSEKENG